MQVWIFVWLAEFFVLWVIMKIMKIPLCNSLKPFKAVMKMWMLSRNYTPKRYPYELQLKQYQSLLILMLFLFMISVICSVNLTESITSVREIQNLTEDTFKQPFADILNLAVSKTKQFGTGGEEQF